jgi:hypothetical protein
MKMSKNLMTVAALIYLAVAAAAAELDEVLTDHASAVLAAQFYTEVAPGLLQDFVELGRSAEEADALTFQIVDGTAKCSVRELQAQTLPQIRSFIELLFRNETMASVTHALDNMYTKQQLNEMQSEISKIIRRCQQRATKTVVKR